MTVKLIEDSRVLSIRVPATIQAEIKLEAAKKGLTPSVYVRTMLYAKFQPEG